MFGRRMLILVAVLMGLTALAASVSPPPDRTRPAVSPAGTPAPATAVEPAAEPPSARTVMRRLRAGPGARGTRVRARVGDLVVLDVTGDVVDTVVIGDLPAVEPIDPDAPAHIELYAEAPGAFPIRLLEAARQIGVLDIRR
jgi:hypothetical protein